METTILIDLADNARIEENNAAKTRDYYTAMQFQIMGDYINELINKAGTNTEIDKKFIDDCEEELRQEKGLTKEFNSQLANQKIDWKYSVLELIREYYL